ncbi:MAG: hypothetical protein AB8I08_01420 [Sandaracinaceae bacterium]
MPEMGERTIATDVGYDELGNIFVAGLLAEPVDFGSGTSVENAYLISYAPNGSLRWVRSATADVLSLDIAVGAAGERVYVTGRGSAEGTSLAGVAVGSSYFLAVLDMDGTEITARRLPGIGFALPSTEGVVVVGMSESAFDFGGGTEVPLAGTRDLYIATYDRDGTSTGATTVGAAGTALTVEAAGEMGGGLHAVMFDAGGPFSWGGTPFLGDSHVLVVVDATGSLRWSREISRVRGAGLRATSLAAGDGQLLISGELYEEQDLGGGPIGPAPGDASECFVVATDLEGAFLWQRTISGFPDAGDGRCNSARLDVLPDGSVLVGGAFNDMVSVGSGGLVAAPLASYLASFDRDGGLIYDRVIGAQSINRVAAGPSGLVFLAGSASGVVDLGSGPRSTGGTQAGFLLRLGE